MFLCYLIDLRHRAVVKVNDGFDRASELLASEALELQSLWQAMSDRDSSVDVVYSPGDAKEPWFRVRLTHSGKPLELVIAGKGVLIVCGAVPADIASQIATAHALGAHIEYPGDRHTAAADWLRSELGSDRRIPSKRAGPRGRRVRRHGASS